MERGSLILVNWKGYWLCCKPEGDKNFKTRFAHNFMKRANYGNSYVPYELKYIIK